MPELRKRPVVLVVRDGWGENPYPEWNHANAVHLGRTPVADRLGREFPSTLIHTSGEDVGLPAGIMGNSEVGHQNIGAGRIVDQELLRITKQIRTGELERNPVIAAALARVAQGEGRLHLVGLASEAGVHSSLAHLFGLVAIAKRAGVRADRLFIHNFTDGRDTPPTSGIEFCQQIEAKLAELGVGRIASVVGRYYAMDRDNRWDRVEAAYRLLVEGRGKPVRSAPAAYSEYYEHPSDSSRRGDEFIEPAVVVDESGAPLVRIESGDTVLFYNFRGDRPRELCKAFCLPEFPYEGTGRDGKSARMGFARGPKLDLAFLTLTEYERGLPVQVAIPKPEKMKNILGGYCASLGLAQFRCAETEKFPHVTFFFNDYREEPFDREDRAIIPSPRDVSTYDQKPEMSAYLVTEEMLTRLASGRYDLVVLNYANGDMVGHTGSLPAAIRAVEVVDECVGRVVEATLGLGGALLVTADHGNCEQMIDPATGGPHTAHTTYDVPLIVVDPAHQGKALRSGGRLADLAPTALDLLGLERPAEMTGRSLLEP